MSTSATSKSASTSTPTTTTQPLLTVQLSMPDDDVYYNALMTDNGGNELGVRIDFLQPDVWFINALAVSNCYADYTAEVYSSSTSYDADNDICYLYGGYTPYTTATVTNGSIEVVYTATDAWTTSEPTTLAYPDGIVAEGVQFTGNLSVGVLGGKFVELDDIQFGLIDDTNVYAGGLGLALSDSGLGLLDALVLQGVIPGLGYSTYFSDYVNNGTGHLILGAVNQLYYTGDFYQYPLIPYEGWTDGTLDSRPLPIVGLDEISLYNPASGKAKTLYANLSVAVTLDPRSSYSYLPWDCIIELAVQTNAYFLLKLDRWLVRCTDIELSEATVNFTFGPLIVPVPLSLMLTEAYYNDNYLFFSDGDPACFLTILPVTDLGYYTLGLPFLSQIYFAMDTEGGTVAMANKKPNVNVSYVEELNNKQVNGTFDFPSGNDTVENSVGYISSGTIPFATMVANSSDLTMTFLEANVTNTEVIPSRFSAVVIQSGEIYVTIPDDSLTTTNSVSATAASAPTPSSGAVAILAFGSDGPNILYFILFLGGILGVCLA